MASLARHIHLAVVGSDVVLLDTRSDAYLCVPDGVAHLRPLGTTYSIAPTSEAEAALRAAGMLSDEPDPGRRPLPTRPVLNLEHLASKASWRDLIRLALAVGDLLGGYRGRNLHDIIAFAGRPDGLGQVVRDEREVERLAHVFHRAAPWLPISGKCLVRSFVLLRFLQRSGQSADWVFGVATWPFSAHCWIQSDARVLDDHWERLLIYEPIMVVRYCIPPISP